MGHLKGPGADPGILVRGAWIFFSKAWGFGAALGSPVGPLVGAQGGEAPGSSGILVNSGVKFNHIISPQG